MKAIDFAAMTAWCEANGYRFNTQFWPSLPDATQHLKIPLPSETQDLPQLLDDLVHLSSKDDELLIWTCDWTIWNERSQEIGLRHWDLLIDSLGVEKLKWHSNLLLLNPTEWREAIALLTVPALYGWDAYLMFRSAVALVKLSHDGRFEVSLQSGVGDFLDSWIPPAAGAPQP